MIYISSVCFSQTISEPAKEKNASDATQPIKGWRISADSARLNYDVFLDTTVRYAGNAGASIKSKVADATRKGALMQTIKADDYIGKRMRLSVYAKAENAEYAALWMRMDGDGMKVMNTDTMEKRPIKGTSVRWFNFSRGKSLSKMRA